MKSKASIKSHPLHPMLIPFPIAFYTGTLLAHAAGWLLDKPELFYTAYLLNVAGVVAAVVAAIPGIIDFIHTVPPKSSGKKRAAKHGLTNSTALLIFLAAALYRRNDEAQHSILLALELVGMILTGIAGWMGGTLVYRNQIGIDQRYANSGKWNEAHFSPDQSTIDAAASDELKVNAMKLLHIGNKRIVLARTEDGFAAFDDRCPHKGGSLAGGSIICSTVQCPWHGSQFSVRTGAVTAGPGEEPIKTYPVVERDGRVFVEMSTVHGQRSTDEALRR